MSAWLILGGYTVGWLLAARWLLHQAIMVDEVDPDDRVDMAFALIIATIAAIFWPLAAPIALVAWRRPKSTRELRDELETARWEARKREQRIAWLEWANGLRDGPEPPNPDTHWGPQGPQMIVPPRPNEEGWTDR